MDEAIRKAKLNARRELSPDEAQAVSGGKQYFDENGRRILATGEPYCVETAEKYAKDAMAIYEITGEWASPWMFLDELDFSLTKDELVKHGMGFWLARVRETYGGY